MTFDYMLDTNVFNDVLDGRISLTALMGKRLLIIGVQAAELRATQNSQRRTDLLAVLEEVKPARKLASSAAWGVEGAGWGQARWNDGSGDFEEMLHRLEELDRKRKRGKDPLNQLRDILIAETAIKIAATLVSGDRNLRQVVSEFGGRATDHFP